MMLIPPEWMPDADIDRIVIHWTVGRGKPNGNERAHYHFLIDDEGRVVRGEYGVQANSRNAPIGRKGWPYAAHVFRLNSGSIGVSMCGMLNATLTDFGPHPLNQRQWDACVALCAQLAERYRVPVTERGILGHCEVERVYGVDQLGKWDPWAAFPAVRQVADLSTRNWGQWARSVPIIGGRFRDQVSQALNKV